MPDFFSTFILGLLAAVVGSYLQHRAWRHNHREELRRTEFAEARQIVHELSQAVDRRLQATSHFALAVSRQEDVDSCRAEYRDAVSEWMGKFSTFKSNIFLYFGWDEMLRFEREVHASMRQVGDVIARTQRYREKTWRLSREHEQEFKDVHDSIAFARHTAFLQLRELNDRIAAEQYGTVQHYNNLEVRDLRKITHTYLLQRLLGIKSAEPANTY